jgi:hypothetical protein
MLVESGEGGISFRALGASMSRNRDPVGELLDQVFFGWVGLVPRRKHGEEHDGEKIRKLGGVKELLVVRGERCCLLSRCSTRLLCSSPTSLWGHKEQLRCWCRMEGAFHIPFKGIFVLSRYSSQREIETKLNPCRRQVKQREIALIGGGASRSATLVL